MWWCNYEIFVWNLFGRAAGSGQRADRYTGQVLHVNNESVQRFRRHRQMSIAIRYCNPPSYSYYYNTPIYLLCICPHTAFSFFLFPDAANDEMGLGAVIAEISLIELQRLWVTKQSSVIRFVITYLAYNRYLSYLYNLRLLYYLPTVPCVMYSYITCLGMCMRKHRYWFLLIHTC